MEKLKLSLRLDRFESENTFKAAMGQRGLNPRDMIAKIRGMTLDYPEEAEVNLMIRIKDKEVDVSLRGLTMSYMIRRVVEGDGPFDRGDAERVFDRFKDQWMLKENFVRKEGVISMIMGSMKSMKYNLNIDA